MVLNNLQIVFGRFTKAMVSFKYKQSQRDHTLFTKDSATSKLSLLLVYSDRMIIARDEEIQKLAIQFETWEKLSISLE